MIQPILLAILVFAGLVISVIISLHVSGLREFSILRRIQRLHPRIALIFGTYVPRSREGQTAVRRRLLIATKASPLWLRLRRPWLQWGLS